MNKFAVLALVLLASLAFGAAVKPRSILSYFAALVNNELVLADPARPLHLVAQDVSAARKRITVLDEKNRYLRVGEDANLKSKNGELYEMAVWRDTAGHDVLGVTNLHPQRCPVDYDEGTCTPGTEFWMRVNGVWYPVTEDLGADICTPWSSHPLASLPPSIRAEVTRRSLALAFALTPKGNRTPREQMPRFVCRLPRVGTTVRVVFDPINTGRSTMTHTLLYLKWREDRFVPSLTP